MKTIPMTNTGEALVDDEDYEWLTQRRWYSVKSRQSIYAKTGKNERMHRMILGVTDSKVVVDHVNGDGMDNRRSNLRLTTVSENVKNRQRTKAGNKFPGVWFGPRANKWRVGISVDYRKIHLGFFKNEDEAISVANAFRVSIGRPPVITNN